MRLGVVALAAGSSRRFGSNKLFFPIDGKKMYERCLAAVEELSGGKSGETGPLAGWEITVTVVTQYEEIAAAALSRGFEAVRNPRPQEGISSSLKLGLAANREADACLFVVADQPWLTGATLKKLATAWATGGKGMACAAFGGVPGNPCIFSRKYFPKLLALTGDVGGKQILRAHPQDVTLLEADEKELTDIDTKQACQKL